MKLIEVANKLVEARKALDEQLPDIVSILQDQSLSLDERWEAYAALVQGDVLITVQSYGDGFVETLSPRYTLYDHFHCDRYEVKRYLDMIEDVEGDWFNGEAPTEDASRSWKEKVLASGHAAFKNDW